MLAEWVRASPGWTRWGAIGVGEEGRRPSGEQRPPQWCCLLYQAMSTGFEQLVGDPASQTI